MGDDCYLKKMAADKGGSKYMRSFGLQMITPRILVTFQKPEVFRKTGDRGERGRQCRLSAEGIRTFGDR